MHTSLGGGVRRVRAGRGGGGGGGGGPVAAPPPPPPPPRPPQAQRSTFLLINDLKPIELIVFFICNSLIVY